MNVRRPRLRLGAVLTGLVAATSALGSAGWTISTIPNLQTTQPAQSEPSVSELRWWILDDKEECSNRRRMPEDHEEWVAPSTEATMTSNQTICIHGPDLDLKAELGGNEIVIPSTGSGNTIDVSKEPITWEEANLAVGIPLSFGVSGTEVRSEVAVLPEIAVEAVWREVPSGQPRKDGSEADSSVTTSDTDVDQSDDEKSESDASTTPVVGEDGLTKILSLVGRDAAAIGALDGVIVRDEINPNWFQARTGSQILDVDEDHFVSLLMDGGVAQYQLGLAPAANAGQSTVAQRTRLLVGETELWTSSNDVTSQSPNLSVEVQAIARAKAGSTTEVSIRLTNNISRKFEEPLQLVLVAEGAVDGQSFSGASDNGRIDGDRVEWELESGFQPDSDLRNVKATFDSDLGSTQVVWTATLMRSGHAEPMDSDSEKTDINPPEDDDSTIVDFDPGQLVQLIGFVVSFAFIAVIFGAWSRNRGSREGAPNTEVTRNHELNLFRSYSEAILVLVIVVAVLVLALQGSLNGESAASLIGVIAGYALGQGIRRQ